MKDTVITTSRKKRELMILLICFAAAYILNIIGIVRHGAPATELITQLHLVLLITVIFYGVVVLLRLLYFLISRLWVRKK
ncbi:MAG: hypothetical protein R6U78_17885 [Bacteroidales bacterium]